MVSDQQIMDAYRLMAQSEGIFCEPASAAGVAGLLELSGRGLHLKGKRVVCILTGTGLKDPDLASKLEVAPMDECPPELGALERVLALA